MSDARAVELIGIGNGLFEKKKPLHSYLQDIADNFYVERADFTRTLWQGQDLSAHLMDSYPQLCRRELGDAVSGMLRPRGRQWFMPTTGDDDLDEFQPVAEWRETIAKQMKRAIYDPRAGFIRASKMTDHDFVSFGNGVLSKEQNEDRTRFRFRNWHFRDCAWMTNADNEVDHIHRKSMFIARNMIQQFGEDNVDRAVKGAASKSPTTEFEVRHLVMPSGEYDLVCKRSMPGGKRLPFVSVYIDATNGKVLREGFLADFGYICPRWHTVSNWQYGFSPAAVISLPDARVIQQMTRVIMEHGEKLVDPPLIATEEAVRSDINVYAGGVTYISPEYDEKMGEALRKLDISGDPRFGVDLRQDLRTLMAQAWYINKLALPQDVRMTAYEVSQRVEEYVRTLLPFFEPIEVDYNARLLDMVFEDMLRNQAFNLEEMPDELSGRQISWSFDSPLQAAEGRLKVSAFQESLQIISAAAQIDQGVISTYDIKQATSDAVRGTGAPADWFASEDDRKAHEQQVAEAQQFQQAAALAQQGAGVAGQVADAYGAMRQTGML